MMWDEEQRSIKVFPICFSVNAQSQRLVMFEILDLFTTHFFLLLGKGALHPEMVHIRYVSELDRQSKPVC